MSNPFSAMYLSHGGHDIEGWVVMVLLSFRMEISAL